MTYTPEYWTRTIDETWFGEHGLLRPDQLAALCYAYGRPFWGDDGAPREPGVIVSIGCGTGLLEATLERLGETVIGVDPHVPAELYEGSDLRRSYEGGGNTVLFVESLEHLSDFDQIWGLVPFSARVIITNWPDRHPILPDGSGWDHVHTVDDELFGRLAVGRRVVVRRGSHLVLDAPSANAC